MTAIAPRSLFAAPLAATPKVSLPSQQPPSSKLEVKQTADTFTAGATAKKAAKPLATAKYETRGLPEPLDPKYDQDKWDNDHGSETKLKINAPNDPRLQNLARNAAHQVVHQKEYHGSQLDTVVCGRDGKEYRLTVRERDPDVTVDVTPMPARPSQGKKASEMKKEMESKGIKFGTDFSAKQMADIYDGWSRLDDAEQKKMKGVTLKYSSETKKIGDGTEGGAYDPNDRSITFNPGAFAPGLVGDLHNGAATFLHEAGHVFQDGNKAARTGFNNAKGHEKDITPYDAATPELAKHNTKDTKVDVKGEHFSEAYMLYKADPDFMRTNYPRLFEFFEKGKHVGK